MSTWYYLSVGPAGHKIAECGDAKDAAKKAKADRMEYVCASPDKTALERVKLNREGAQ